MRALLSEWNCAEPVVSFLDLRARHKIEVPASWQVSWVAHTVFARLRAEIRLSRITGPKDVILCFHGLPPQLPNASRILVFLQNRHYLERPALSAFGLKTRLRLVFERSVGRLFRRRVSIYLVQTESMRRALANWYGESQGRPPPAIRVLPFVGSDSHVDSPGPLRAQWDFVYVADGEPHKNHRVLLAAWQLLAEEGWRPSLAITLGMRASRLKQEIEEACIQYDLRIVNLGEMQREEVLKLYRMARALIFPSTSESFGLPLVEAASVGLPILASELDYVRDVCDPAETFNAGSAVSIARAVKRFLGTKERRQSVLTPGEFWKELQQLGTVRR